MGGSMSDTRANLLYESLHILIDQSSFDDVVDVDCRFDQLFDTNLVSAVESLAIT